MPQCQMHACSNFNIYKYSSWNFVKVQSSWSKLPKGVSIIQIVPKILIPGHKQLSRLLRDPLYFSFKNTKRSADPWRGLIMGSNFFLM